MLGPKQAGASAKKYCRIIQYEEGSIKTTITSWRLTNTDMDIKHTVKKVEMLHMQLNMTHLCTCFCI